MTPSTVLLCKIEGSPDQGGALGWATHCHRLEQQTVEGKRRAEEGAAVLEEWHRLGGLLDCGFQAYLPAALGDNNTAQELLFNHSNVW